MKTPKSRFIVASGVVQETSTRCSGGVATSPYSLLEGWEEAEACTEPERRRVDAVVGNPCVQEVVVCGDYDLGRRIGNSETGNSGTGNPSGPGGAANTHWICFAEGMQSTHVWVVGRAGGGEADPHRVGAGVGVVYMQGGHADEVGST